MGLSSRGDQAVRRLAYFFGGFVPAGIGVVLATAHGSAVFVAAFAGAVGLLLATAAWVPAGRATYRVTALLLGAGACAMVLYAWHAGLGTAAAPLRASAPGAWLLLGPPLCAGHFLWAARPRTGRA